VSRDRHPNCLFFPPLPQHRCIAAREADLAMSVRGAAASARHWANAARHRMLADAEANEALLILR
jgi:hypothetical protein